MVSRYAWILGGALTLVCSAGLAWLAFWGPTRPEIEGASQSPPQLTNQTDSSATTESVKENPDHWPAFRGPKGTGVAPTAAIPTTWSATKNMAWKTPLPGPGASSPIVWGDAVFVTCYSGYGDGSQGSPADLKRHLLRVDANTGKIVWEKVIPTLASEDPYRGYLTEHGYASQTPVTDGKAVYAFFGKSGVHAFDMDGKPLWQKSVGTQSSNRRWGSAASLILERDRVIVNASEESRAVLALDKATGNLVWEAKGSSLELCFGTPVPAKSAEGRTDLVLALPGEIWGINPETGKLRWFCKSPLGGNISPSVAVEGDKGIAFGGYPSTGAVGFKLHGKGDVSATAIAWQSSKGSYVPSPVILNQLVYWLNDRGQACCCQLETGQMVYQERLPVGGSEGASRPVYASVIASGDTLIGMTRRDGAVVWKADPKFQLLAINKIEGDDSDFNGTPAIAQNKLFLRSNKALYCVSMPK